MVDSGRITNPDILEEILVDRNKLIEDLIALIPENALQIALKMRDDSWAKNRIIYNKYQVELKEMG